MPVKSPKDLNWMEGQTRKPKLEFEVKSQLVVALTFLSAGSRDIPARVYCVETAGWPPQRPKTRSNPKAGMRLGRKDWGGASRRDVLPAGKILDQPAKPRHAVLTGEYFDGADMSYSTLENFTSPMGNFCKCLIPRSKLYHFFTAFWFCIPLPPTVGTGKNGIAHLFARLRQNH